MSCVLNENGYAVVYREDSLSLSHVLCLIDVNRFINSLERLTNFTEFPPGNIQHLSSEIIRKVTLDYIYSCLSIFEKADRNELRVSQYHLTLRKPVSLRPQDADMTEIKQENLEEGDEENRPITSEHSLNLLPIKTQYSNGEMSAELDKSAGLWTGVDIANDQQFPAASSKHFSKSRTLTLADNDQLSAGVPMDGQKPITHSTSYTPRHDDNYQMDDLFRLGGKIQLDSPQAVVDVHTCSFRLINQEGSQQSMAVDSEQSRCAVSGGQPETHEESGETCSKKEAVCSLRTCRRSRGTCCKQKGQDGCTSKKGKTGDILESDIKLQADHKSSETTTAPSHITLQQQQKSNVAKERFILPKPTHGKPLNKCGMCLKEFASNDSLDIHIRKQHVQVPHSGKKPFICPTCDKSFASKGSLRTHMLIHSNERPHVCEICGMRFTLKNALKKHFVIHTKEKPYKCELCGKCFAQSGNLKNHFLRHKEQSKFWLKCEICHKEFALKEKFKIHMRLHTGEKPYLCDLCGKGFASTCYLAQHRKIHDEASYTCSKCGKSYSWAHTLQQHSKTCADIMMHDVT